jgi:hypothetical protein
MVLTQSFLYFCPTHPLFFEQPLYMLTLLRTTPSYQSAMRVYLPNPDFTLSFRMASASNSEKVCCTNVSSHDPKPRSIRSATLVNIVAPLYVAGRLVLPCGIHGSVQMFTDSPLPIRQIIPSLIRSTPFQDAPPSI